MWRHLGYPIKMGLYTNLHLSATAASTALGASAHQEHQGIRSISASGTSVHQDHHWISSISASTASAHQQRQHIRSINGSAASAHQQHQRISSISGSAASAHQQHQCIGDMYRKRYLPIYIKSGHISLYPLKPPDQTPDTRHHQTPSDMVQTPPDTTRHASCM